VVSGGAVTGEVRDATVLIIDDLIATFGTIDRAAQALRRRRQRVFAFATHGLSDPAADVVTAAASSASSSPVRLSAEGSAVREWMGALAVELFVRCCGGGFRKRE
jgi:predicted phosphoribosyltransferase